MQLDEGPGVLLSGKNLIETSVRENDPLTLLNLHRLIRCASDQRIIRQTRCIANFSDHISYKLVTLRV